MLFTKCCVARTPGCDSECNASKTVRHNSLGTYGLGTPVDISHIKVRSDVGNRTDCNLSEVYIEDWIIVIVKVQYHVVELLQCS